jgi:hypothetical protein
MQAGIVGTGIAEGREAVRAILGFQRTLYDYQEFNFVGAYGDGLVEGPHLDRPG